MPGGSNTARLVLVALTLLPMIPAASAQTFPSRPIRIVTAQVGGGLDFVARIVGAGLTANIGQQVIVDNRPSGVFTGSLVSKASPDGHTLLFNGSSFWLLPFLRKDVPYDPVRDFAPITLATNSPLTLVVHPSVPVKSVKELVAYAKSRQGALNYSSSSIATPQHIAGELFKSMAGVNIVRVPYKGAGPTMVALVAGEVQLTFASTSAAAPHVKLGKVRALAVTSAEPTPLAPGLPTMVQSGFPGFDVGSMWGFFAPAATPPALVDRIREEIVKVLNAPQVKEKLAASGAEVVGNSPQQFAQLIKEDMVRGGKVIRDAGIKPE